MAITYFNQSIERYLKFLSNRSKYTISNYRRDLLKFSNYIENSELQSWMEVDDRKVRSYLAMCRKAGLSSRSVSRLLSALRGFFDWLEREKVVNHNPFQAVRAPKGRVRLPDTLDVDQVSFLLSSGFKSDILIRDKAIFELLYSCGLRVSELASINVEDIDFKLEEVRVVGKGNKERLIPVGSYAKGAILDWMPARAEIISSDSDVSALFVSSRGRRISVRTVQARLALWARKLGMGTSVHPHMLRHSFASHLLESSGNLRAVQELLGHSNLSTTQIYTHLNFQHLSTVYDKAHPRARRKKN